MGKRSLLAWLTLMMLSLPLWPQDGFLDAINPSRLPQAKAFRDELQWYRDNRERIGRLGVEEPPPPEEAEVISRLRRLLDLTEAQVRREPHNPDLLLFRVLLYRDFYNFTWAEYRNTLPVELLRLESLFPLDYRPYWFLGVQYAAELRPLEAMRQFAFVTDTIRPEALPAGFFRSYASAAWLADMPKHALEACRTYGRLEPSWIPEEDVVFRSANRFQAPEFDAAIPPGSLYQFQVRENGFGILCRLFGVYVPVDRSWGTRSAEVRQNGSQLVFTPERTRRPADGEEPGDITVEFLARPAVPFAQFVEERLKRYPSVKPVEETPGAFPFLMFEVTDPARRKPAGGWHGFCYFLDRPEPKVKGLGLERPVAAVFDPKTGEPYYRPLRLFDRYDGNIYYVITLACGEDEFAEAAPLFRKFVQGLLFD